MLLVLCILMSAYFIRGITGFGSALIAVPMLALSQPLQFAVPLVLALDFTASLILGGTNPKKANWAEVKILLPFGMLGACVGAYGLLTLPTTPVLLTLGAFTMFFGFRNIYGLQPVGPLSRAWAIPAGLAGGGAGALFGAGSPPYIMYLTRRLLDKGAVRATFSWLIAIDGGFRLGLFLLAGLRCTAGALLLRPESAQHRVDRAILEPDPYPCEPEKRRAAGAETGENRQRRQRNCRTGQVRLSLHESFLHPGTRSPRLQGHRAPCRARNQVANRGADRFPDSVAGGPERQGSRLRDSGRIYRLLAADGRAPESEGEHQSRVHRQPGSVVRPAEGQQGRCRWSQQLGHGALRSPRIVRGPRALDFGDLPGSVHHGQSQDARGQGGGGQGRPYRHGQRPGRPPDTRGGCRSAEKQQRTGFRRGQRARLRQLPQVL